MVGHGGSSAGSYLADPTTPIPSHCASIVVTSTLRVNYRVFQIEADDIGPLLKVRIGHDGKGMFAGWFLDKVIYFLNDLEEGSHCSLIGRLVYLLCISNTDP